VLLKEDFKNAIKSDLDRYMPEILRGSEVTFDDDMNLEISGAFSKKIDVSDIYLKYLMKDLTLDNCFTKIANSYVNSVSKESFFVIARNLMGNPSKALENLFMEVHDKYDYAFLERYPHVDRGPFAATFSIRIGVENDGPKGGTTYYSIPINHDVLKRWGISKGDLHKKAVEVMRKKTPALFNDNREVRQVAVKPFKEVYNLLDGGNAPRYSQYVLTNSEMLYGSSAMFDDDVLKKIGEVLGESYYILPGSQDALIIIPLTGSEDPLYYKDMTKRINEEYNSIESIISDSVAFYDSIKHKVIDVDEKIAKRMPLRDRKPHL